MVFYQPRDRYRRSYVQSSDVAVIRDTYAKLLAEGVPMKEAAERANEAGRLAREKALRKEAAARQQESLSMVPADEKIPDHARRNDNAIPENWQTLPWPQLRDLASRLAGHAINSRQAAQDTITQRLAGS